MVLRMTDGPNAKIHPPMMIFENNTCSYPIRGVNKDVPGVSCRSGPWRWMDKRVFMELRKEKNYCYTNDDGLEKKLYMENWSGHVDTLDS